MQYAQRLASPDVAHLYPMDCQSSAAWQALPDSRWRISLQLPEIPAQHIIVPSFAMTSANPAHAHAHPYQFQFELLCPRCVPLPIVPATAPATTRPSKTTNATDLADTAATGPVPASDTAPASAQIDCWHSETDLPRPTLNLTVYSDHEPERFLLTVTVRPIEAAQTPAVSEVSLIAAAPGTYSQMQADAQIRSRICSPTALSMALSGYPQAPDWPSTVRACYDPLTRAYGVWPLAIHWASVNGIIGAVEACNDWEGVLRSLRQNIPVVCSIRFEAGELPAAPLPRTSGHLVLVYGIDGDDVLAKDPAAPELDQVTVRYPAEAFASAWLRRRGAAYFFARPALPTGSASSASGH